MAQHRGAGGIIVVGGGIGGLATALACARDGRRVRVLEQADEFCEIGAGLQLAPNATRPLRQWGLLDQVVNAGVLPKRLVFRDALTGRELTHLDVGAAFQHRYGAPYVVLHRSDLLDILVAACRQQGVELAIGGLGPGGPQPEPMGGPLLVGGAFQDDQGTALIGDDADSCRTVDGVMGAPPHAR